MTRKHPQSTRDAQHKKPAEIHLINGETVLAPDHDTNNSWCIVYKSKTRGIAKKIPRESILYIDREAGDTSINDGSSESRDIDTISDVTGEVALEHKVRQQAIASEEDAKSQYPNRTNDDKDDEETGDTGTHGVTVKLGWQKSLNRDDMNTVAQWPGVQVLASDEGTYIELNIGGHFGSKLWWNLTDDTIEIERLNYSSSATAEIALNQLLSIDAIDRSVPTVEPGDKVTRTGSPETYIAESVEDASPGTVKVRSMWHDDTQEIPLKDVTTAESKGDE